MPHWRSLRCAANARQDFKMKCKTIDSNGHCHGHHPTCAQSRYILSSLSIVFFALLAIVCLTQPVQAEEAHPEYETVIGIGM